MDQRGSRRALDPSQFAPRLAFTEPRGLASTALCPVRCSHGCNPLFVMSSTDGDCGIVRGGLFLGGFATSGRYKSARQGGNATNILHSPGMLLLLPSKTDRFRLEHEAVVRPERGRFWAGFRVAVYGAHFWPKSTDLVSGRTQWPRSQATGGRVQTLFRGDLSYLFIGEPGFLLTDEFQCDSELAAPWGRAS